MTEKQKALKNAISEISKVGELQKCNKNQDEGIVFIATEVDENNATHLHVAHGSTSIEDLAQIVFHAMLKDEVLANTIVVAAMLYEMFGDFEKGTPCDDTPCDCNTCKGEVSPDDHKQN